MSIYQYGKMTVRGNAETLGKFARYFEGEYDDKWFEGGIKRGQLLDGYINKGYVNENCYLVEGDDSYFFIGIDELSKIFPTLKFEYIQECHDGQSSSDYRICLNGKTVDCHDGGISLTFDESYIGEKCRLCNCETDDDRLCYECDEFLYAMK
jgi:hypothetical protein